MIIKYYSDFKQFNLSNLTIALGYFDGLHIAHEKILKETVKLAKETNTLSAILTFDKSVYDFITNKPSKEITTLNQKISLVKKMGFDYYIQIELSNDFINLSKDDFINLFLKNMSNIVCGFDYSFGKNREGNSLYLKDILKDKVHIIEEMKINDEKIGTTLLKSSLDNGMVSFTVSLLSREYEIEVFIHKNNSKLVISTQNYMPRNGLYRFKLNDIEFDGKIKLKGNEYTIKTDNKDILNFEYEKHKTYKLYLIKDYL